MVDDDTILELVEAAPRRSRRGSPQRSSIAANDAGGEDNITVVLFEVAGSAKAIEETGELPLTRRRGDAARHSRAPSPAKQARTGAPAYEGRAGTHRDRPRCARGRCDRGLRALPRPLRGSRGDGHVAVYQGLPWDLGFGVQLYRVVYESPLLAANLSQAERRELFDHDLRSRDGAIGEVNSYAQGRRADDATAIASSSSLAVVAVITGLGFASVYIARQDVIDGASLSYGDLLPLPLPRRAPRAARHRAVRRSVPPAARRAADGHRRDRDLPHRPHRRTCARRHGSSSA